MNIWLAAAVDKMIKPRPKAAHLLQGDQLLQWSFVVLLQSPERKTASTETCVVSFCFVQPGVRTEELPLFSGSAGRQDLVVVPQCAHERLCHCTVLARDCATKGIVWCCC